MAIEVEVTGSGAFAGHKSNISSYSYQEDSTPVLPGDSSGGVGNLSFSVEEDAGQSILLYRNSLLLSDGFSGCIEGVIDAVDATDGVVGVQGRSKLARLNTVRTIEAQTTTLGAAFTTVLNEVGITTNIDIDASLIARPITLPGYTGDLWVFLKDLCIAEQVEISLVGDQTVLRPLRLRDLNVTNLSTETWNVADSQLAQQVEVAYYNYSSVSNTLVYPKGGWTSDVQVYQVDANQTLVFDLPVDFYLSSIEQPTVQSTVARNYSGPNSVYSVAGNDGLPVVPAQWTDNGGSVSVALKDNGKTIEVTVVGANIPNLAPFRLAVAAGPSDYYSTLRLIGSGVSFDRQTVVKPTGLTIDETSTIDAPTIDNPWVDTYEDAVRIAWDATARYGIASRTYSATARQVSRASEDNREIVYPTFTQWESTLAPGYTFTNFNTDYSGQTFQDFTDTQFSTVAENFDNQAFGNIGGARVRYRDAMYRVRSATSTQDQVSFVSDADTLFSDFNTEWSAGTFGDFNTVFAGLTFMDFGLVPLRR